MELYLEHINKGNGIRIRVRVRMYVKTYIVQESESESESGSESGNVKEPYVVHLIRVVSRLTTEFRAVQ